MLAFIAYFTLSNIFFACNTAFSAFSKAYVYFEVDNFT